MTAAPHRLKVVAAQDAMATGCTVACQATLSGRQEICVRTLIPVTGDARPHVALRLGSVLLLIEDMEAMATLARAVAEAQRCAEAAFGGTRA